MASGGDGELPSREEAAAVATTAVMEADSSSAVTPIQEGVVGEGLAAVGGTGEGPEAIVSASGGVAVVGDAGDNKAARGEDSGLATSSKDMSGSGRDGTGSGDGVTGTPHTPTIEELLAAAKRASGEQREGAGDEAMTAGRVIAMPILRATAAEPKVGDSGIGASRAVPFAEGDFLDSTRPWDILDALGLDARITEVLRGARMTKDQASALLLGALLSGTGATSADMGSPETDAMGGEELEEEVVVDERVTAAAEAKAYLARVRPGFVPKTYAPQLHFFEPTGMTGYVPARTDYSEDLLLRDRDTHISSGWTTV
ncbi:hypothetical protein RHMOL_Rhmol06G0122400 [Rhododendron molle]|uniref:Uncharacterized protein n=1 Tax=Rhododendron molle TaxID=49168 RepID=A0ACC0NCB1_RHOML|nr:hypothetical protein RHMOL_Rhmol06G0122400 [Rhododendron molle]